MSMSNTQANNQQTSNKQVYRIVIEAPVEKVWSVLTKQGEVLPFFFNNVLHTTRLAPGAPVRMRSAEPQRPERQPPRGGAKGGRATWWTPPSR